MTKLTVLNKLPAATVAAKSPPGKNVVDTQDAKSFGAMLAQQVADNIPNTAVTTPATSAQEKEVLADKNSVLSKVKDDTKPATQNMPTDLSGNMIALLQPLQEICAPVAAEISSEVQTSKGDLAKFIAHDLPAQMADTHNAKDAPGIIKTDIAAQGGKQIDPKHLSVDIVKSLETSRGSSTVNQTTAPPAQNVVTLVAPNMQNSTPPAASDISPSLPQSITTSLGNNGWANEFSQKISWMTTNSHKQIAELHLNPPDLGPLSVVLKISDNQATALFTSPHSAVREAVENAMPKLREILADNGITLGNTTVSDQPQRDSNAAAFTGQQSQPQGRHWTAQNNNQADTPARPIQQGKSVQKHDGMVDIFA